MALKAQKELELKVHEEFYNNVHVLTLVCPPSHQFKEVFKKDMFVKNNKVGFQQVVYYLLTILDAEKFKQNVPSWPPYDLCHENKFRKEVMKYINELNSIYEDADIPQLATSHLISPGGFKFIKFMFKLSQVVLCEYIKRNAGIAPIMLLPVKPCKRDVITTTNLEKINCLTKSIVKETELLKINFEDKFQEAKREARKVIEEQQSTHKKLKENQLKLNTLQKQFNDSPIFNSELLNIQQEIEKKLATLKGIKRNYDKCQSLNAFLSSDDIKLEHNKQLKMPSEILHLIVTENENLDLTKLLEACNSLINHKRLEVKPLSNEDVVKEMERFTKLNQRLTLMNEDLEQIYCELELLSEKLENKVEDNFTASKRRPLQLLQLPESDLDSSSDSSNSTVLALPLSASPSPAGNCSYKLEVHSNQDSL